MLDCLLPINRGFSIDLLGCAIEMERRYGEELKTRDQPQLQIHEKGEVFFFYRPKVEREQVHCADDVQRLYIVLRPEWGERESEEKQDPDSGKEAAKAQRKDKSSASTSPTQETSDTGSQGGHGSQEVNVAKQALLRLIVMGRKSLPDPTKKSRPYWGFVDLVTTDLDAVRAALAGADYETSTKGHRHVSPARPVGEGVYRILSHYPDKKKKHIHLIYKLEFPGEHEKNEPQHSLNIDREASFLIQIKNPHQEGGGARFRGLQNKRRAVFPAHLQGQFGHLMYSPADPPDFLNYEGCEFLLIAASDDIEEELGLELHTQGDDCSDLVKTFGDTAATTTDALFKGSWV